MKYKLKNLISDCKSDNTFIKNYALIKLISTIFVEVAWLYIFLSYIFDLNIISLKTFNDFINIILYGFVMIILYVYIGWLIITISLNEYDD